MIEVVVLHLFSCERLSQAVVARQHRHVAVVQACEIPARVRDCSTEPHGHAPCISGRSHDFMSKSVE